MSLDTYTGTAVVQAALEQAGGLGLGSISGSGGYTPTFMPAPLPVKDFSNEEVKQLTELEGKLSALQHRQREFIQYRDNVETRAMAAVNKLRGAKSRGDLAEAIGKLQELIAEMHLEVLRLS